MRDPLESALNALRPGFEADGFEVSVESVEPGGVVVVPEVTKVTVRHEKVG